MCTDNWRRRYKRLTRAYWKANAAGDAARMIALDRAIRRLERQP